MSKTKYWADHYIRLLNKGKTVQFRTHEKSLEPFMVEGDLVTMSPIEAKQVKVGDIILCKIGRTHYLRIVKEAVNNRFFMGDNRNQTVGWTEIVYGKVIKVEK